jgi:hypothetical protein
VNSGVQLPLFEMAELPLIGPPWPDWLFTDFDSVRCLDCDVDTFAIDEYYMVNDDVWTDSGVGWTGGMLCIGCLEDRLGRQLVPGDFMDAPINGRPPHSERLRARLRGDFGRALA